MTAGFRVVDAGRRDGRFNIVLRGVKRFRVESESFPDAVRLYRLADARWLDVYEDDDLDEAQLVAWIDQAARLPGVKM